MNVFLQRDKPSAEDVADMSERIRKVNAEMCDFDEPFEVGKAYAFKVGNSTEYGRVSEIYDEFIEIKEIALVSSGDLYFIIKHGLENTGATRVDPKITSLIGLQHITIAWELPWWDEQKEETDACTEESKEEEANVGTDADYQGRENPGSEEANQRDGQDVPGDN